MPLVVGFRFLVHLIVSFLDCHRSVSYFSLKYSFKPHTSSLSTKMREGDYKTPNQQISRDKRDSIREWKRETNHSLLKFIPITSIAIFEIIPLYLIHPHNNYFFLFLHFLN